MVVVVVNLKYIENPFEQNMMHSISCFCEERSFFDCIQHKFLDAEAFQHLEHTFHMYFLIGDSQEWIGYVLFSNEDLINDYYQFICQKTLNLLDIYKTDFIGIINREELERLKTLILKNDHGTNIGWLLEEISMSFEKMDIMNNTKASTMFEKYQKELQNYLVQFPKYFYLDIVISLSKEEASDFEKESYEKKVDIGQLVESKYYGFIQETFNKVEKEVENHFKDVPILIKRNDKNTLLANDEMLSEDKRKLIKKLKVPEQI